MQISFHTMIDVSMFLIQITLAGIGWKIKADVEKMRSHMYEHFLTKQDFASLWSNR